MTESERNDDDVVDGMADRQPDVPERTVDPFEGPGWSGKHGGDPSRIRVRRRRSRKKRVRRRLLIGGGILAGIVLAALGWLLYSGLQARSELAAVRDGVRQLRAQISAGDLDAARATARQVQNEAKAAHDHTSGPLWAVAAAIPILGDPVDTARTLTSSVELVADNAMAPLIDASNELQPNALRLSGGGFDLRSIERLDPTLQRATQAMDTALQDTRNASGSTWLGSVNSARQQLLDELAPLRTTVSDIHRALLIVPAVLGADGPRTYMISFENDAELRATGGLPGAFVIVKADHGKISFTHFESDNYLIGVPARGLHFGPSFSILYQTAQEDYRDSNYSPHFPYAAQIWSAMWQRKTGEALDGAMIIDPTALSYLLAVTGPVTLPDGTQVTSDNVVELTQKTLYDRFPDNSQIDQRKAYLLDIAQSVSAKLLAQDTDATALVQAAGQAAGEHRLLFWSRDPKVEDEILDLPLSGVLPQTAQPYVAVSLNNDSQSKLDYYLHAALDYRRTGCGPTRHVTATLTITNDAPATLPQYVTGFSFPPGTETLDVGLYGSIGGKFTTVTVNGKRQPFHLSGRDQNHPAYVVSVNIPRGKTSTVVFQLTEPVGTGPVIVRDQPMVNPMTTKVTVASC